MKEILWVGKALQELRSLAPGLRASIGYELDLLQRGRMPSDFKSMPSVGKGVYEIRARDEKGNNIGRCFYVTNLGVRIAVLYSFVKKAEATPEKDIEQGRARFKMLQDYLKAYRK